MNISDQQLRQYVDNVFGKYDKNSNFTLDEKEMYQFFKDLFASMNFKHNVTMEDVKHSLKQIDANHDGKVTKRELYNALKSILGSSNGGGHGNKKQPNQPYQQPRQKHQEPPRQKNQQEGNHQQQLQQQQAKQQKYDQQKKRQQQLQQQNQKPNSAQGYDYNQKNHQQQPQQQKKPVVQPQQKINKVPGQVVVMPGMDLMGPFGGMGPGGMMMDPMYGGMGPPPGMGMGGMGGGMNPFGFW